MAEALFDKYTRWLRETTSPDDVDMVMECVNDDAALCCITEYQRKQLELLAEERTAALRGGGCEPWE